EAVARAHCAEVFTTVGNTGKKSGALNQVLRTILDDLGDNDVVMCMDADTVLEPGLSRGGCAALHERLRADGDRRSVLRRGRSRAPRPAPAQRVRPLLARDQAPPRSRVRADRDRVDVPGPRAAH